MSSIRALPAMLRGSVHSKAKQMFRLLSLTVITIRVCVSAGRMGGLKVASGKSQTSIPTSAARSKPAAPKAPAAKPARAAAKKAASYVDLIDRSVTSPCRLYPVAGPCRGSQRHNSIKVVGSIISFLFPLKTFTGFNNLLCAAPVLERMLG